MAELTSVERLQPCLLERLRDDDPSSTEESRNNRVVSLSRYKDSVLRDIRWLLNAKCPPRDTNLEQFAEAAESVVNYGLRDFCGVSFSAVNVDELRKAIETSLRRFEPRINRHTLKVAVVNQVDRSAPGTIAFEIRGELWAKPIPEQLFIRTRLDLETGQTQLY